MTFHKVDTVIYQPRGSDVHRSQRVKIVNCCCFLDISIYSFVYVAASNQQTPVFKT